MEKIIVSVSWLPVIRPIYQGILKALYLFPEKSIGLGDAKRAMSLPDQKKANVEKMFFEGQKLVDGLNPTPTVKMQAMGRFACNLILAILDKRHKELPKFGSLEDCGCQLLEDLRSLGLHVEHSPWADHREAEPKQAAKKARTSADGGSSFLGGCKLFIECNGPNSKGDKV